ncbi:amino acid adenylation domain-containing protein [Paenibacillus sp. M1]|uniref:Amino acid adenylation domain-containing protein n=1 Tax=Paenibacillus haidiansis TaxID=1574488 RepID=A0ABU7VPT3_9BACL
MKRSETFINELPRAQKEEMLRRLLDQRSAKRLKKVSYGERALWLLHHKDPDDCAYHVQAAWDIGKPLDERRLYEAVSWLYEQHDALRTTYFEEAGEIYRKITPAGQPDFHVVHLPGWNDETNGRFLGDLREPFNLEEGPLIRFRLYVTPNDPARLLLSIHHIITDAWSLVMMLNELFSLYEQGVDKPRGEQPDFPGPLPAPGGYEDFVAWQEQYLNSERAERDRAFWNGEFSKPLPAPPLLRQRSESDSLEAGTNRFRFSESLSADIVALSRTCGVTVNTLLMAGYAAMLHCCSGQGELVIGTFTAGRNAAKFEHTLGYFVNTLPMRLTVGPAISFSELIVSVKNKLVQAIEHQDYPYPLIVQHVQQQGEQAGAPPLIQTAFVMERAQGSNGQSPLFTGQQGEEIAWGSLRLNPVALPTIGAPLEFTLMMEETERFLGGAVICRPGCYSGTFIQGWIASFTRLMKQLVEAPERSLEDAWKRQTPAAWLTDETVLTAKRVCMHHLLEYQARHRPQQLAISCPSGRLSYDELERSANRLARYLRRIGVKPGEFVGVSLERSPELIISAFAILKAGAVYVPIDPTYPEQRKSYMARHVKVSAMIADSAARGSFGEGIPHVCLDESAQAIGAERPDPVEVEPLTDIGDLAYVIFTSGSTGDPKAVLVEHRGIWNMAEAQRMYFGISESSRIMQFASPSFDAWIFELVMAFRSGGALFIPPQEASLPGPEMSAWLEREKITHAVLPPSVLALLPDGGLDQLEVIISAGEACSAELVRRWAPGRRFFNAYGPSETTVWATVKECGPHDAIVSLGEPIPNMEVHVFNDEMEPVSADEVGELYIAGVGIARSYYNDPERTAAKFARHAAPERIISTEGTEEVLLRSRRMYRTGDLVKKREDGSLEFAGRKDDQVKIRGIRINLGEIEARLAACEGVTGCIVLPVAESGLPGMKLAAFVSLRTRQFADEHRLRRYLEQWLPPALVPSRFILLDRFPLTPNGKADRKALLAALADESASAASPAIPGLSPTEELLLEQWRSLLQRSDLDLTDSFFAAGGHSLLAVQLASRIRQVFDVDVPVRRLFEKPTLQEMAAEIDRRLAGDDVEQESEPQIEEASPGDKMRIPLTGSQQTVWFMQSLDLEERAYLLPGAVSFQGPLNISALESAIRDLIGRHDALRLRVDPQEGLPCMVTEESGKYRLVVKTCTPAQAETEIFAECRTPIKVSDGRLFRIVLWDAGGDRYFLTLVVHHLIMDGWSMSVLLRDLGLLYEGYVSGRKAQLPPVNLGYADYAVWEWRRSRSDRYTRQIAYWTEEFKHGIPALELPADYARQPQLSYPGNSVKRQLSTELAEGLQRLARRSGCTLFMTLLAVFDVLLYRLSGQSDVVVGVPTAGRTAKPLEPVVGMFVNTLLLRSEVTDELLFSDLLRRVRETALSAYANQDVPLEKWVKELDSARDTGLSSLFRVMFNMLNMPPVHIEMPGVKTEILEIADPVSKFELTLYVRENADGLALEAVYAANLFAPERIREMLAQYERLCVQIVGRPEEPIGRYSLLPDGPAAPLPDPRCPLVAPGRGEWLQIDRMFAAAAAKYADNTAIIEPDGAPLTYRRIDERSETLANRLMQRMEGERKVIAILGHRSAAFIVSVLAALKAGAVFVILDPRDPLDRLIARVRKLSGYGLIVAGQEEKTVAEAEALAREVCFVLNVREDLTLTDRPAGGRLPVSPAPTPAEAAYILFTSGTTSEPKAVVCGHEPLARFVGWYLDAFRVDSGDRFSMLSGMGHDPLLRDMLVPLCAGAAVCIPDEGRMAFPDYVTAWMRVNRISIAHLTPAMAAVIKGASKYGDRREPLDRLRCVIFSGDALSASHISAIRDIAPDAHCYNGYGTTETPQLMSVYPVAKEGIPRIALGQGRAGVQLLVMGPGGELRGVGETGEIVVRSPYLALGYLNATEDDDSPFRINPYTLLPGDRIYRTGDWGRYNPDGTIEFLGRKSGYVKIRGHRVQTAEIRDAIMEYHGVSDSAVRFEATAGERLIAYIVPSGAAFRPEKLKLHLRDKLPEYMMPFAFVEVKEIPLTSNGKVDFARLSKYAAEPVRIPGNGLLSPATKLQREIADIWRKALQVQEVGVEDHFFEIGGHSLLLIQVHQKLEALLGRGVPIVTLFRYPTIADLAAYLEGAEEETAAADGESPEAEARRNKRLAAIKAQKARRKGLDI